MIRKPLVLVIYMAALLSPLFIEQVYRDNTVIGLQVAALFLLSFFALIAPAIVFQTPLRLYLGIISVPIMILSGTEIVHLLEYHSSLTYGGLVAVGNTGLAEANEFVEDLRPKTTIAVLAMVIVCLALLVFGLKPHDRIGSGGKVRAAAVVFMIAFCVDFPRKEGVARQTYPFRTAVVARDVVSGYLQYRDIMAKRTEYRFDAVSAAETLDRHLVIVVIGESLRRDHLPQYQYFRNTTPVLSAQGGVWFSDAISPGTTTMISLSAALTPAVAGNYEDYYRKRSVVSVARELGYQTAWFSNQRQFDFWGTRVSIIGQEAETTRFISSSTGSGKLDEKLLPLLRTAIQSGGAKQAIFLHTYGNHRIYRRRYTDEFRFYESVESLRDYFPDLSDSELREINEYDNSIRYVDHFLGEVIAAAGSFDGPVSVVFFSDHGEGLYDDESKLRGRGFIKPLAISVDVPFYIWSNDAFRAARPGVWAAIEQNRAKPIVLDSFFHAFAGLIGAEFADYQPQDDFFPPASSNLKNVSMITVGIISN